MSEIQGLAFPFRFDPKTGSTQLSQNLDHLRESLKQILGIRPGERFMRPDFGSKLKDALFEGNDEALKAWMRHHVIDAIRRHEPRVEVLRVDYKTTDEYNIRIIGLISSNGLRDVLESYP